MTSDELLKKLTELGIQYDLFEHEAVFTVEESQKKQVIHEGVPTKNLFLRDEKGKKHFLVVQRDSHQANLKELADKFECKRLSFASAERLQRYLGVTPGSVGLLGLIHDVEKRVQLFLDESLGDFDALQTHPLINNRTVVLKKSEVQCFLDFTGHASRWC